MLKCFKQNITYTQHLCKNIRGSNRPFGFLSYLELDSILGNTHVTRNNSIKKIKNHLKLRDQRVDIWKKCSYNHVGRYCTIIVIPKS